MKSEITFLLEDQEATEILAARLASCISRAIVMTFSGEIGAGKTTFIRAMLRAIGVQSAIKSPTFSLVESYSCKNLQIHHFDLYRIQEESELEYLGFRDYFAADSLCCIEWPEQAGRALQGVDLHFSLEMSGMGRRMRVKASSVSGLAVLSCLRGEACE